MNKQSKIIVMGGVIALGFAGNAMGAAACSGTAGNGTSVTGVSTSFIRDGFTPKCSANVTVSYTQSDTAVAVKGGSSKGMHTFGGTSEGGGVKQCETTSVTAPGTSAATAPASVLDGCS